MSPGDGRLHTRIFAFQRRGCKGLQQEGQRPAELPALYCNAMQSVGSHRDCRIPLDCPVCHLPSGLRPASHLTRPAHADSIFTRSSITPHRCKVLVHMGCRSSRCGGGLLRFGFPSSKTALFRFCCLCKKSDPSTLLYINVTRVLGCAIGHFRCSMGRSPGCLPPVPALAQPNQLVCHRQFQLMSAIRIVFTSLRSCC
jgi:hypothetical protein